MDYRLDQTESKYLIMGFIWMLIGGPIHWFFGIIGAVFVSMAFMMKIGRELDK